MSYHIDSRPAPPSAGASFGLVVITPAPCDPRVPHHDPGDEAEMCRLSVEYSPTATALHDRSCGRSKHPADTRRPRGQAALLAHPPTPADDTPREEPRTTGGQHSGVLGPPSPEDSDPRKTAA